MNLFLVTSPFQYICAVEARSHYKTENNILLLVEQPSEPGLSQQKKLVNENDWEHVIKIPRKNRTRNLPKVIKEIWKITNREQINNFFHAEYNGWRTKLLLRNLNIDKEVYFDDGTLTLHEYETLIRPKVPYERKRLLQDFLLKLRGCKPIGLLPQSKKLEVFTIFNIPNARHKIVNNSFSFLKSSYGYPNLYSKDSPIGFIGQGAIGHKRMKTIDEYISELKAFKKNYNKEIIYFPHRTETIEIKNRIIALGGITYHESEYPLEIELIDKKIKLSGLVGINSTAQYTAIFIYDGMPIYNIASELDLNSPNTSIITKRVYNTFKESGILDMNL
ncbi:glycosyltransferase 52 family protein [Vibrio sp. 10N.247.311.51]|uniref:glycosyltransferase 52 family protein n=1 Tax=Vibrio sp. 10N.247.311.51 TaxID=3229996 RepID=UPI0035511456